MVPYARKYLVESSIGKTPILQKIFENCGAYQWGITAIQLFLAGSALTKN